MADAICELRRLTKILDDLQTDDALTLLLTFVRANARDADAARAAQAASDTDGGYTPPRRSIRPCGVLKSIFLPRNQVPVTTPASARPSYGLIGFL